jgi:hypothetical protein
VTTVGLANFALARAWVTTMTSSKPNSRFSTLKVFKIKPDASTPPPPPPKDPQYLANKNNFIQANRSLASLSPDSLSIPSTPLSPHFLFSRPTTADASQSAVSLISNGEGITRQPSDESRKKPKPRGVFGFGRKTSKGPPSIHSSVESEDLVPPRPQEDDNISMPWNFQVCIVCVPYRTFLNSYCPSITSMLMKGKRCLYRTVCVTSFDLES